MSVNIITFKIISIKEDRHTVFISHNFVEIQHCEIDLFPINIDWLI